MNIPDDVLKQVVEALESHQASDSDGESYNNDDVIEALRALRKAMSA